MAICNGVRKRGKGGAEERRHLVVCQCSLVERRLVWRGRWHAQASEQRAHGKSLHVAVSSLENGDIIPRPGGCLTCRKVGVYVTRMLTSSLRHFIDTRNSIPELILNDLIARSSQDPGYARLSRPRPCMQVRPSDSVFVPPLLS